MSDYTALAAEAEEMARNGTGNARATDLLDRCAAAIRELTSPPMTNIPDGWEATEYTRADGKMIVVATVDIDTGKEYWTALIAPKGQHGTRFPTASAAIAALEEAERG